ncbi:MAG TPA: YceI family protein [Haliscomenobacter sp.]|uniref:YceI family protein n=1 Tax=Haliscomenobacter sp. TaxID=2717303 RepID=UPI002D06A0B5|nr:YceI family protein [Haliscomenobacter sp.]HOY15658.1 YceI family protein [Haliscomenobacter sp.]
MNATRFFFLLMLLASITYTTNAQSKYFTRSGTVIFDAEGKLDDVEEIKAKNTAATCVLDAATGQMEWAVTMNKFTFASTLMQKHFNENYVESEKYPKATFKGKISDIGKVNFSKDGTYPVTVNGTMNLHGVTKEISAKGVITVEKGKVLASSGIEIGLKDYKIDIPTVVFVKIAETAKVSISAALEILNGK